LEKFQRIEKSRNLIKDRENIYVFENIEILIRKENGIRWICVFVRRKKQIIF